MATPDREKAKQLLAQCWDEALQKDQANIDPSPVLSRTVKEIRKLYPPNNACAENMTDPLMPHRPVILFDGDCNFCNAAVRWTVKRDKRKTLRFARLQSPAARRIVAFADPEIDFEALPDSMAFVDKGGVYTSSSAALRVARYLRFPWPVLVVALAIPRFLRDSVYRFIARNRYRWFGASAACPTPPPDFASRLLATEEDLGIL